MGQVRFHRTVPLVLRGTSGIGRTRVLVGQVGYHSTVPLVLQGHRISWDAGGILMAYLDITRTHIPLSFPVIPRLCLGITGNERVITST